MKIAQMNVDYVDHMGTDLTIVNSARVSFDKTSDWEYAYPAQDEQGNQLDHEPPKVLSAADAKLITYLAKHNHWSPFAHTSIQLRVKAPIFVARQLVKHQVGGVWNEVSRRYVDSEPEFYMPQKWRGRAPNAKQGSSEESFVFFNESDGGAGEHISDTFLALCLESLDLYNRMLTDCNAIAPEMARMVLPQNMMTEWYWTGSLVFWARVCKLRLDPHAQAETSEVAHGINRVVEGLFPVAWKELMA